MLVKFTHKTSQFKPNLKQSNLNITLLSVLFLDFLPTSAYLDVGQCVERPWNVGDRLKLVQP